VAERIWRQGGTKAVAKKSAVLSSKKRVCFVKNGRSLLDGKDYPAGPLLRKEANLGTGATKADREFSSGGAHGAVL